MSETVKVLYYKSKTLSDGKHPLMVRVCKDGKKKYQSIGISIHPSHWDFKKNEPNELCPNRDEIRGSSRNHGAFVKSGRMGC